jgi:hypothetical protein
MIEAALQIERADERFKRQPSMRVRAPHVLVDVVQMLAEGGIP